MDKLEIANCRGRNAVLRDIRKAMDILDKVDIEINAGESCNVLSSARSLLFQVLNNEGVFDIKKSKQK